VFTNLAWSVGHLCLSSLSPSKQLHFFEEDMTPKKAILQPSKKKTIRSAYEGSIKASTGSGNQSTKVMTRSTSKADAFITLKKQVVTLTLQSHKTQKFDLNLPSDGISQTACLSNLKLKPLTAFNTRKTLPQGMDEFQTYINRIFQPISEEEDDYGSSDFSPTYSRDSVFSQLKSNPLTLLSCQSW